MLVNKAFAICDSDQTGHVCKTELYAGLLLVHRTWYTCVFFVGVVVVVVVVKMPTSMILLSPPHSSLPTPHPHPPPVNLAKYAGPAACYPPTRAVVDQLFDAADADHSGSTYLVFWGDTRVEESLSMHGVSHPSFLVFYLLLVCFQPLIGTNSLTLWELLVLKYWDE